MAYRKISDAVGEHWSPMDTGDYPQSRRIMVNSSLGCLANGEMPGQSPYMAQTKDMLNAGVNESTQAVRHDSTKPQVSLIPSSAIIALADVMTFGATKYAADNWRKGMEFRRCLNSAMRHLLEVSEGRDVDAESGKLHAAHVMANMAFLIEYMATGTGTDDRFKGAAA